MVGAMREPVKRAEIEPRAVVSWEGPGEPIMLTIYGPDGEVVAVPLLPAKALKLAQELLTQGVQAIKADPTAPWAPGHARAERPFCRRLQISIDASAPRAGTPQIQ